MVVTPAVADISMISNIIAPTSMKNARRPAERLTGAGKLGVILFTYGYCQVCRTPPTETNRFKKQTVMKF